MAWPPHFLAHTRETAGQVLPRQAREPGLNKVHTGTGQMLAGSEREAVCDTG